MFDSCPGGAQFTKTPTLKFKKCPQCGNDVELFSTDQKRNCDKCGFTIYNDLDSCIQWCRYARECVGDEMYEKLKNKTVAFLCVGNSARSQMAEALAKKLARNPKSSFISGGTDPAEGVSAKAVEVLKEEGIDWQGSPKPPPTTERPVDIVVTMGCDVACPTIPGAKVVSWDIPDPKGKDIAEYRRVLAIIKGKVKELLEEMEL